MPFWRLVDGLAGLQAIGEREQALAADIVAALECVRLGGPSPRREGVPHDQVTEEALPAWSEPFAVEARAGLARDASLERLDRAWAWEGSTGRGVTVAIIDSGLERDHPALAGRLVESVAVEIVDGEPRIVADDAGDLFGHGTACGGIIVGLAPEVELVSIRVLGRRPAGQGRGLPGGPRLGHRARRAGGQPEPLVEERGPVR